MADERTFKRGEQVLSTSSPTAMVRLRSQGYVEIFDGGVLPQGMQDIHNVTGDAETLEKPRSRRGQQAKVDEPADETPDQSE